MSQNLDETIRDLISNPDSDAREEILRTLYNKFSNENNQEALLKLSDAVIRETGANSDIFSPFMKMQSIYVLVWHYIDLLQADDFNLKSDDEKDEIWGEYIDRIWQLKWALESISESLEVDLEFINNANDFMKDCYENVGFKLSAYYKILMLQAQKMGNVNLAKENYKKWQDSEDDAMSDCEACNVAEIVNYHHFIGEYEKALEFATPLISGELSCAEVPHVSFYAIIESFIHLQKWQEAKEYAKKATKKLIDDKRFDLLPGIIVLINLLGETEMASELFTSYTGDMAQCTKLNSYNYMQYCIAAAAFNDDAKVAAERLAKEFDARNGNDFYKNHLKFLLADYTDRF